MFFSSRCRESIFHRGVFYLLFSGRKEGGQSAFLAPVVLVPLAQNSQYAKTVCFGVANSNPLQLLTVDAFAVSEGTRRLNSALQTVCPPVPVGCSLWVPLYVGQPHGVEWTSPEDV